MYDAYIRINNNEGFPQKPQCLEVTLLLENYRKGYLHLSRWIFFKARYVNLD